MKVDITPSGMNPPSEVQQSSVAYVYPNEDAAIGAFRFAEEMEVGIFVVMCSQIAVRAYIIATWHYPM